MKPNFHVLGAGSIGQLLAHALRQNAHPVTLLVRKEPLVQQFLSSNSELKCEQGKTGKLAIEHAHMELVHGNSAENGSKDIHNLIVSTKGNNAVEAVKSVLGRLHQDSSTCIILIQNGILAVYRELWKDVLSRWDVKPRVIIGSFTHGAYLASNNHFHLIHSSFGTGTCMFAEVDAALPCLMHPHHRQKWTQPRPPALESLLSLHSLSPEHPSPNDFLRQLQLKLAINCAINPLTAVLGCLNGHLLEDASTQDTMGAVCAELHAVFGSGASITAGDMYEAVLKVASATATNKSSMRQDLSLGRPTELPYLNGFVVQQGEASKVAVPVNKTLCQLVNFLESKARRGKGVVRDH